MVDKDEFAVWVATTVLEANGDGFGAAALAELARVPASAGGLDAGLVQAASNAKRPGDFGVEFVGPLLPVLLVEFGRILWDAYSKALVEQGGKALATATVDQAKALVRRTFGHGEPSDLSAAQAEKLLRAAGEKAHLTESQVNELLGALRNPEAVRALAGR